MRRKTSDKFKMINFNPTNMTVATCLKLSKQVMVLVDPTLDKEFGQELVIFNDHKTQHCLRCRTYDQIQKCRENLIGLMQKGTLNMAPLHDMATMQTQSDVAVVIGEYQDERKKITGQVLYLGLKIFSCILIIKQFMSLHICETEYVSATSTVLEVIRLRNLLKELDHP